MDQQTLQEFLELANLYPSPHNGQPIRLRWISDSKFEVYFQRERGLQATDISYIFSFVSMGVFIEHLSLSAQALGHKISCDLELPAVEALRGTGSVKFAVCRMNLGAGQPDEKLKQALIFRQTSRKKYYQGVSDELAAAVAEISKQAKMRLARLDKQQARQAIWLNQRAVFDDMFDEPVREELDHWLRYTQKEKQDKKDGLAYDCMELNGRMMKLIVDHPKILRMPGISSLLKQYYLRTMTDASDVFYMLAPFATEQDSFEVGVAIMKIWRAVAEDGYCLHPFGTIMSNHAAHQDFLKLAQVHDESREANYLVFIFRCGKSKKPVPSLRLPVKDHLLLG